MLLATFRETPKDLPKAHWGIVCFLPASQRRLSVHIGTFKSVVISYLYLRAGDFAGKEAESSFPVLPWVSENVSLCLVSLQGAPGPQRRGSCRGCKGQETLW